MIELFQGLILYHIAFWKRDYELKRKDRNLLISFINWLKRFFNWKLFTSKFSTLVLHVLKTPNRKVASFPEKLMFMLIKLKRFNQVRYMMVYASLRLPFLSWRSIDLPEPRFNIMTSCMNFDNLNLFVSVERGGGGLKLGGRNRHKRFSNIGTSSVPRLRGDSYCWRSELVYL